MAVSNFPSRKKWLVTGATGLVGSYLLDSSEKFLGLARSKPSWLTSSDFIEGDAFSPKEIPWSKLEGVIFLAFPTKVQEVQTYTREKQESLVRGFENFVKAAQDLPVLFFSSDAVFWGTSPTKREANSPCAPTTVYGSLKHQCEEILLRNRGMGHLVVRATPIGFHKHTPNHGFLGGLLTQMFEKKSVKGFQENLVTPISLRICEAFISDWIKDPKAFVKTHSGRLNIASTTSVSKYDLLRECAQASGTLNYLGFESKEFDQTILPSPGFGSSLKEVLSDLLQNLEDTFLFSTKKSPIAK